MLKNPLTKKYTFLFFLFLGVHIAVAIQKETSPLDKFVSNSCLTLEFSETSVFDDDIEKFSGILIRNGKTFCILYPDNNFTVLKIHNEVRIKDGDETDTYDLDEFPNPLLKILFYIDKWKDFFEIYELNGGTVFKLIPKDENLKDTVAYILVKIKGKTPEVIKIVSDPTNYVVFKILKTSESCKIVNKCNI